MTKAPGSAARQRTRGWRLLGLFWLACAALLGGGATVVTLLGPPDPSHPDATGHAAAGHHDGQIGDPPATHLARQSAAADPPPVIRPGRDEPGPIIDPDPALSESVQAPEDPATTLRLPRAAGGDRVPMRVYAAGFDPTSHRPRVAVLLAGIGLNEAESDAAIRLLPAAVTLALSPYAGPGAARLLGTARTMGHEYLLELPLEPEGYPLNDPGPLTLLTSHPVEANLRALHKVLARSDGYAGVAGMTGGMRGQRLSGMRDQMEAILSDISARGLMYVDPNAAEGGVPAAWGRHADLVFDDPARPETIDARLNALEQRARDSGAALGLVPRPTPAAVARIAAWSNGLLTRGVALAPVSAIAVPPVETSAQTARPIKVTDARHE